MASIEDALAGSGESQEWLEVERFFGKKDRHYAKVYLEEQAKYEMFHEEAQRGIHACKVQRAACAQLDEYLSQMISKVDKDIRDKVLNQRQERHTRETRLEKLVEEKCADVRALMYEEQKTRKTGDDYTKEVTNEVCHLYNDIEQAKEYRLQKSEKLQHVVSQKLDEIHVAVAAETKVREESTQNILEVFGGIGNKMQKEIDDIKRERKESTERLLALMEVVLPHLQQARLNHAKLVSEKIEDQRAAARLAGELGAGATQGRKKRESARSSIVKTKEELRVFEEAAAASAAAKESTQSDRPPSRGVPMSMEALRRTLPIIQGVKAFQSVVELKMNAEAERCEEILPADNVETTPVYA